MGKRKVLLIIIIVALFSLIGLSFYLIKDYSNNKKLSTVTFVDGVYVLPSGWLLNHDIVTEHEELNLINDSLNVQARIGLVSRDDVAYDIDALKDIQSLETFLTDNYLYVHDGELKTYHGKKVAVFQYNDLLFAYINAYDNHLYAIRIISGNHNGEEVFYDYDALEEVVAILNTVKKK